MADLTTDPTQAPRRRTGRPRLLAASALLVLAGVGQSVAGPASAEPADGSPVAPGSVHPKQYVQAPSRANQCPTAVVSTSGDVQGPRGVLCGRTGSTTLTTVEGGAPATVLLDYGHEVGGLPHFAVSRQTGTPTLRAAYSEGRQFMSDDGDVWTPWADGDKSRADSYRVDGPGLITNPTVQGGERYQQITLTTPGSVTLRSVGIRYLADRTRDYPGSFVSSSDELNRIWYAGAYTLQTNLVPAHSLPGTWVDEGGALDARGSDINDGAGTLVRGSSWRDYTSTFRTSIVHNQAGWMVRAKNAQNGYLFILNSSTDTTGTPNTLQQFDVHDGTYTSLGSVPLPAPLAEGSWHQVSTTVAGSRITVALDGAPLSTVDTTTLPDGAPAFAGGTVGFKEYAGEEALFDDLAVVGDAGQPLYDADFASPSDVRDFVAPGSNLLPSVLDGARRDRAIWSGDINLEGLTDFYSVDKAANIKQSLALLGSRQLTSGFVPGSLAPAAVPHLGPLTPGDTTTYSASYSMYFVTALATYYLYTGDRAFLRQQWATVQRQLAWNRTRVDANGLLATRAGVDGADWDFYDPDKGGEVSAYNMIYYRALTDGATMAEAVGDTAAAADYSADAARLRTAINDRLYDTSTGLYSISDTQTTGVAQDANSLAVLYGVAPAEERQGILDRLKEALWTTPFGPLPFSRDAGFSDLISPFVSGFELQARLANDDTTNATALLHDVWGHMLADGPDQTGTMWENISSQDGTPGLGNRTSLAHGWSTAPTSALSAYVLGVQPATAGYATWSVQPHPGDLTWAKGRVPTPHGDLVVRWDAPSPSADFTMSVTAPSGTGGTIAVPTHGAASPVVTVNGAVVWQDGAFRATRGVSAARADSGYVYLTVSGRDRYSVSVDPRAGAR